MTTKSQRKRRRNERAILQAAAPEGPLRIEGDTPVDFIAAAGEKKLATFGMTLYTGGKMRPRGYSQPVVVDLSTTTVASGSRPFLANHDPTQPVGHGEITIDATSIKATGTMSVASSAAEGIKASAANGFPWKSSIGADVGKLEFIEAGKQVTVNNRKFNGPIYVARNNVVYEGSFVTLAGDNRSSATVAATLGDHTMTPFEKWLQAKGIDLATLADAAKTALQAAFDTEQKPVTPVAPAKVEASADEEDEEEDKVAQLRAEYAAETKRVKGVRTICAAYPDVQFAKKGEQPVDLEAHAIAEGWSAEATELYALRAARPAPAVHSKSHDTSATLQALQGAMILRAGKELDSKIFQTQQAQAMKLPAWIRAGLNTDQRQKAMEAAWRYRDMSMFDVAIEAMRLDGKDVPAGSRQDIIQAAFSGSSLTNIFTTNVNTVILATYMEASDTTMGWVREADVADFKSNERPRMTKGPNLALLPAGQTADHATRSDLVETYKIARYAKQFVIDDQDFINDSFGAMNDTPVEMGNAARRLRPDLVYYILMSNPALGADAVALFHSTHNNLNTSATLASATIKAAIADIELQTENSVNLNLRASHLIVPPSLKHSAAEFINSSTIQVSWGADNETLTERGTLNTINSEESLRLVVDARLENGVTDPASGTTSSGSASTWFMASTMGHTIEVGYLRGTGRVPSVRSFTLDRGQWGIGWDVKHDIGAKALDYRGLHKNTA